MQFIIATIATLAATASAMAPRETTCCKDIQAMAYLGKQCSGLALLNFTAPVSTTDDNGVMEEPKCFNFHNSTDVAEGEDAVQYYTEATCVDGIYTANIWVGDNTCTAGGGVYPLEQGIGCSSEEVTTGIHAALEITCVE